MTAQNNSLLRLYFKLAVYQKSGMEFQSYFSDIMRCIDSGFEHVKPYGNWGDGGNDGCNSSDKHYYQIYAPVATTKVNAQEAFKKAITDYQKLLKKWGAVLGYSFVINDRFTGIEAPLLESFNQFKADQQISQGKIIDTRELQKLFMQLSEDDKLEALGLHYLAPSNSDFEPTAISELVQYLINKPDMGLSLLTAQAPDFDQKIQFNRISDVLANKLKGNSIEVYKIDEFLDEQGDESLAQELAQTVNTIYNQVANNIPDDEENRNELIYIGLIDNLIPMFAKEKVHANRGYTNVAEIIIAKYFETCDTYEDPNSPLAS